MLWFKLLFKTYVQSLLEVSVAELLLSLLCQNMPFKNNLQQDQFTLSWLTKDWLFSPLWQYAFKCA